MAKTSKAQIRASANYAKRNVITKGVRFYPKDRDIAEWVASLDGSFNAYVCGLIREDMKRQQGKQ